MFSRDFSLIKVADGTNDVCLLRVIFGTGFFSGFNIVGQAVSSSHGVRLHQDEYHPFPFDFPGKFIIGLLTVRKAMGRVYHNICKMSAASILQSLAI